MSKRQKELDKVSKKAEKDLDKKLFDFYKNTLKELKKDIKLYIDEYEELSTSEKIKVNKKKKVANEIDKILKELANDVQLNIFEYLAKSAKYGYYGALYDLEGKTKMAMDFNMLNERYIKSLVNKKVAGKNFSKRLYQNRNKLAKTVTNELLQGTVEGKGYRRIAKNIAEQTESNYKQALRIARTEGGRVQTESTQRAYEEAEDLGVELQKQWVSSLDDATREEHADLDGQIVGIDEDFEIDGYTAPGPRLFGDPAMDINCRCTTITIVNGISPKLRKDNISKDVTKYKSYNEWMKDRVT